MLASQKNVSDTELFCVANTMLSLGTESLAQIRHHNDFQTAPFHSLYRYDLRSVDKSKTILHLLYAVLADYINAFVE